MQPLLSMILTLTLIVGMGTSSKLDAVGTAQAQVNEDNSTSLVGLSGAELAGVLRELQPVEQAMSMSTLMRSMGSVRTEAVTNLFLADPEVFQFNLPGIDAESSDVFWNMFFRTSEIFPGNLPGEKPIFGFYSPFVDMWLITQWQLGDNSPPSIVEAYLASTEMLGERNLSGGDVSQMPGWMQDWQNSGFRMSIQNSAAMAANTFWQRYPEASIDREDIVRPEINETLIRSLLRNRLGTLANSLAELLEVEERRTGLYALIAALASNDGSSLSKIAAEGSELSISGDVFSLDEAILKGFEPLAAITASDSYFLILSSEFAPRVVIFAQFVDDDEFAKLKSIGVFDALGSM